MKKINVTGLIFITIIWVALFAVIFTINTPQTKKRNEEDILLRKVIFEYGYRTGALRALQNERWDEAQWKIDSISALNDILDK
jgi:hypothetical protein